MKIFRVIKYIIYHPLNKSNKISAILRFIKWQFSCVFLNYTIIHSFTEKSKLIIVKGMTGATGNLYCGLHEFSEMSFLLHFLRNEDTFIDVGANIGSYSILASGQIGAISISIEPSTDTFLQLLNNIYINNLNEKIKPYQTVIGCENIDVQFTKNLDSRNHIINSNSSNIQTETVKMDRLDNIIKDKEPILIKIDVEGFETEVINSAVNSLKKESLKAIIIELNGSGLRYNYNENEIHLKLLDLGFKPYTYEPFKRELCLISNKSRYNTIYLRDFEFVTSRIKSAQFFKVLNFSI